MAVFLSYLGPRTGTRKFQSMHSTNRHESAQVTRNTTTRYDWPFIYRNNSLISLTGFSSRFSRRLYFSFSKATRAVVKYPVTTPSYITDGGTSSRLTSSVFKTNCDYLENCQSLRKPVSKTFNRSACGIKMQMFWLPSPCGLVQF